MSISRSSEVRTLSQIEALDLSKVDESELVKIHNDLIEAHFLTRLSEKRKDGSCLKTAIGFQIGRINEYFTEKYLKEDEERAAKKATIRKTTALSLSRLEGLNLYLQSASDHFDIVKVDIALSEAIRAVKYLHSLAVKL